MGFPPLGWNRSERTHVVKAIETTYRGIKFRSRTEARWAVFLDNLGLAFDYEPEGYELDAGWYLPDFYVPDLCMWIEVKPNETDQSEVERFSELCRVSGKHGVIAYGPPSRSRENLLFFDSTGEQGGKYAILEDRRDDGIFWLSRRDRSFAVGGYGLNTDHDRWPVTTPKMAKAHETANTERFGVHE